MNSSNDLSTWTASTFLNLFEGCFLMQYVTTFSKPGWPLSLFEEYISNQQTPIPVVLDDLDALSAYRSISCKSCYYWKTKTRYVGVEPCLRNHTCRKRSFSLRKLYSKLSVSTCIVQNLILNKPDPDWEYYFSLLLILEMPHFGIIISDKIPRIYIAFQEPFPRQKFKSNVIISIPKFYLLVTKGSLHIENYYFEGHRSQNISRKGVRNKKDLLRIWHNHFSNLTGVTVVTNYDKLHESGKNARNSTEVLPPLAYLHVILANTFNYSLFKRRHSNYDDYELLHAVHLIDTDWNSSKIQSQVSESSYNFIIIPHPDFTSIFAGEFSKSYFNVLYVKRKGLGKGLGVFISPFDKFSLIGIAALFISLNIVLTIPYFIIEPEILKLILAYLKNIYVTIIAVLEQLEISVGKDKGNESPNKMSSNILLLTMWVFGNFFMLQYYTGSLFSLMTSEIQPFRNLDFAHLYDSSTIVCVSGTELYQNGSSLQMKVAAANFGSRLKVRKYSQYDEIIAKLPYCREGNLASLPERIAAHDQIQTHQGGIPIQGEISIVSPPEEQSWIEESMRFLNYFIYKRDLPYSWYRTWVVGKEWAGLWNPILKRMIESGIYGKWEKDYEASQKIQYLKEASKMWNAGSVLHHNIESPYKTKNFFMWTHLTSRNVGKGESFEAIGMDVLGSVFGLLGLCFYICLIGLIFELVIHHKYFMTYYNFPNWVQIFIETYYANVYAPSPSDPKLLLTTGRKHSI
ncbi:unnamed protein product [Orchesella dallaii]|uniref:Uncharacterized protein n=1 Tax=Orchesella dallaii TaxID=48710 RepID=A0ABP1RIC2_9HEXA